MSTKVDVWVNLHDGDIRLHTPVSRKRLAVRPMWRLLGQMEVETTPEVSPPTTRYAYRVVVSVGEDENWDTEVAAEHVMRERLGLKVDEDYGFPYVVQYSRDLAFESKEGWRKFDEFDS